MSSTRGVKAAVGEHPHPGVEQPPHGLAGAASRVCAPAPARSARDLYASLMIPTTIAEAARRFGDRIAYVSERAGRSPTPRSTASPTRSRSGLAREGVREGDVVGLVLPPGPEYLLAYCAAAKLGAITAGVNDRLSIPERGGAAISPDRSSRSMMPAASEHGAPRLRGRRRPRRSPTILIDPSRSSSPRARPVFPKGAVYCNRQLAFITQTDTGGAWDTGGRSFSGTSFAHLGFMTKLPGSLQRGGTTFIMERWRAADALELLAREQMTTVAGVPTQLALMLRQPDFDAFDLSSVRFIIAGGGPVTPGLAEEARRRFGALLATRYSCTEAGIGLGTAFDDPDEDAIVSVGRPHASVDLALLDEDDRPVTGGRGRRGVPALPRGDVGLLARSRADRPPSPPTGSCAPATSAGSTIAAGSASSGGARRCTCAAATTSTRSRSRACSRPIPTSPRSRSCRADDGDGRGRCRRRWRATIRAGCRRSTICVRSPADRSPYKLPEALSSCARASAHRGGEGRPCVGGGVRTTP